MRIKKILSMFLVTGILFSTLTNEASAVDFKFSGTYQMTTEYNRNINFKDNNNFFGVQRFRPILSAVANEYLYANLGLEIGNSIWGNNPQGAGLSADAANVKVRHAFIDWKMPGLTNLSMRVGIQNVNTPSATFGSPVFDDTAAGISLNYAINSNVGLGFSWSRPYIPLAVELATVKPDTTGALGLEAADLFLANVPLSFAKISVTPWGGMMNVTDEALQALSQGDPALLGNSGNILAHSIINRPKATTLLPDNELFTQGNGIVWWAGLALEVNAVKNLNIGFDFIYGATEYTRTLAAKDALYDPNMQGFYTAFSIKYSLPVMGVGLKYWYASGNDSDFERNGGGIMPSILPSYTPVLFAFDTGSTYRGSCDQFGGDRLASNQGVAIEFSDITFVKDVTHLIELAYIMGTSNSSTASTTYFDSRTMTTKDHAVVVNFMTEYKIYENLSAQIGISYSYMLENNKAYIGDFAKDNFAAGLGIQYAF